MKNYSKDLAMAVVVRNGRVLVQERFRPSKGMVFEFPGGSIDNAESGESAAIRELWEEAGLAHLGVAGSHTLINEFGGKIYYVVIVIADDAEPQAIDPRRRQTFYWFRPKDIPRQDLFRADIEFLDSWLLGYV